MLLQHHTLDLTKAELKALLAHASTDETKPHLSAIVVEPGACPPRVWACDGSRVAVAVAQCPDTVGSVERTAIVVPRQPLDQALRLAGGTGRTVRLRIGPREDAPDHGPTVLGAPVGQISIEVLGANGEPTGASLWCKRSDAQAPPIDNVLPDPNPEPGVRAGYVHLDPVFLGDLRHVVAAAESDPHPAATLAGIRLYSPTGEVDPVAFTAGAWTVVLMPRKGEAGGEVRSRAAKPEPKPEPADATAELPPADQRPIGKRTRKRAA
jgi:hypothetical protein